LVTPPSLTVNEMFPFSVVLAMVKLSPDMVIVMSDPAPIVKPESLKIPREPDVVSAVSDLRYDAAATPPNLSESVAVP
jgi:hypothetical protein